MLLQIIQGKGPSIALLAGDMVCTTRGHRFTSCVTKCVLMVFCLFRKQATSVIQEWSSPTTSAVTLSIWDRQLFRVAVLEIHSRSHHYQGINSLPSDHFTRYSNIYTEQWVFRGIVAVFPFTFPKSFDTGLKFGSHSNEEVHQRQLKYVPTGSHQLTRNPL